MSEANDWNAGVIAEFRANEGRLGGQFAGAPMVLVHSTGRKSGQERINPTMYRAEGDPDVIYVFASKGGAPTNPDWYYNLTAGGQGSVEIGTDAYDVAVTELTGDERDRVYTAHATQYPGFAEYAEKTAGVRTIPVLALRRI
jgi:deazaflavin-dependent oxidoreductase (nitroreductase family)